jgi:hypothetical protein
MAVERDAKGHFKKGHAPVSPGRPKAAVEIEYMAILKQGVTPDDWRKIVNTAVSLAMAGDWKAREWVGNYLVGRPNFTLELKAPDAVLLNQLLKQLEATGTTASELFEELLNEYAQADVEATDDGQ